LACHHAFATLWGIANRFAFDPVTKEAYFEASAQNTDIRDKPLKGAWYWYAIAGETVTPSKVLPLSVVFVVIKHYGLS
jgi:hypothetical protein